MIAVNPMLTRALNTAISYKRLFVAAHAAAATTTNVRAILMGTDSFMAGEAANSRSGIKSASFFFLQPYL
jgi:hypothetical protein